MNENGRGLITGMTVFFSSVASLHSTTVCLKVVYFLPSLICASLLVWLVDNVIRENQWGGADIRRGGDPILRNNFICHGYSDGVVVGERGRGLIEGNHIYGKHFLCALCRRTSCWTILDNSFFLP